MKTTSLTFSLMGVLILVAFLNQAPTAVACAISTERDFKASGTSFASESLKLVHSSQGNGLAFRHENSEIFFHPEGKVWCFQNDGSQEPSCLSDPSQSKITLRSNSDPQNPNKVVAIISIAGPRLILHSVNDSGEIDRRAPYLTIEDKSTLTGGSPPTKIGHVPLPWDQAKRGHPKFDGQYQGALDLKLIGPQGQELGEARYSQSELMSANYSRSLPSPPKVNFSSLVRGGLALGQTGERGSSGYQPQARDPVVDKIVDHFLDGGKISLNADGDLGFVQPSSAQGSQGYQGFEPQMVSPSRSGSPVQVARGTADQAPQMESIDIHGNSIEFKVGCGPGGDQIAKISTGSNPNQSSTGLGSARPSTVLRNN